MSHFTVMVFSKHGTQEEVEELLAPFHEFECTGRDDKYVQDIDKTESYLNDYKSNTSHVCVSDSGEIVSKYDNRFYPKRGTGDFMERDTFVLLDGWTEKEIPTSEFQTFAEFVNGWGGQEVVPFGEKPDIKGKHKYGYILLNEDGGVDKVIDRTNQNKKWDWYQIGGRWAGYFKPKEKSMSGTKGERSLLMSEEDVTNPDYADFIQIRDIDLDGMEADARAKANDTWDKIDAVLKGRKMPSWTEIRRKYTKNDTDYTEIDKARDEYHNLQEVKDLEQAFPNMWDSFEDSFGMSREAHILNQTKSTIVPFAFVDSEGWHGRGRMGWFGCASDEEDYLSWCDRFWDSFNKKSPDSFVCLVDCHI